MDRKLASDAVKQMRSIVTTIIVICVVWFVTIDAVRNSLVVDRQARELAAWLVLRELLPSSILPTVRDYTPGQTITCLKKLIPIQSGTEDEDCVPLVAQLPWPGETSQNLHLVPISGSPYGFRIGNVHSQLPLSDYAVAFTERGVWIFPSEDLPANDLRAVFNAALRDGRAVPRGWTATRTLLRARGWQGNQAEDAHLNDPVVAGLIGDVFTKTYSISGVPVSPRLFPSAVSLVLATMGFLLLGPATALARSTKAALDDSWVMLLLGSGLRGSALGVGQICAIVLCAVLPLAVAVTQLLVVLPFLHGWNASLLLATVPGACGTSVVLAYCGALLLRWRRPASVQPNIGAADGGR
jgi:hypothetical protein